MRRGPPLWQQVRAERMETDHDVWLEQDFYNDGWLVPLIADDTSEKADQSHQNRTGYDVVHERTRVLTLYKKLNDIYAPLGRADTSWCCLNNRCLWIRQPIYAHGYHKLLGTLKYS